MDGRARLSAVVPADDEERVLRRCLDALARQLGGHVVDILVVANGFTDRTADLAREHRLLPTVLDLLTGSKHAAPNAGDAAVTASACPYLVADVVLSDGAVEALHDALTGDEVHAAAPRPESCWKDRPWTVRAHYRIWQRLTFLKEQLIGNGVYGVGAGRRRWQGPPRSSPTTCSYCGYVPGGMALAA